MEPILDNLEGKGDLVVGECGSNSPHGKGEKARQDREKSIGD